MMVEVVVVVLRPRLLLPSRRQGPTLPRVPQGTAKEERLSQEAQRYVSGIRLAFVEEHRVALATHAPTRMAQRTLMPTTPAWEGHLLDLQVEIGKRAVERTKKRPRSPKVLTESNIRDAARHSGKPVYAPTRPAPGLSATFPTSIKSSGIEILPSTMASLPRKRGSDGQTY